MSTLLFIALTLLGLPLFVLFGWIAMAAFGAAEIDASAIFPDLYRIASQPILVAIPLFTFAGFVMAESGLPRRIIRLSHAALSWLPGGLALMSLVACALFTAFTGASGITIIALGGLLLPLLVKDGYPERYSLGLMTTSGSLGLLFPPSLPLILYGLVAGVSVDALFRAGLLPGLLILLVLGAHAMAVARRSRVQRPPFSWPELKAALRDASWELPIPPVVLVLIYGGFVTPAEAAAVTTVLVLFVEGVIHRELDWATLKRITGESMALKGAVLAILGLALGLTNYLIDAEVPQRMLEWMGGWLSSPHSFLLLLNVFLLAIGGLMDIFSAIVVVVPLIVPVAAQFGVDPLHLGIIFLTNLEIGYLSPPAGLNLLLASFRFRKPFLELYRAALPFLVLMLLCLAAVTWIPALSLWLGNRP
jgi:tripartite ATP-independent transporter DctM subunit